MFRFLSREDLCLGSVGRFWDFSCTRIFNLFFGFEFLYLVKRLDSDFACPVE